jgi:hypothetical protein
LARLWIRLRKENMADPKLQVEKRLDRLELAIGTMAQWLVQAQTGFNATDAEGIEKILRGEVMVSTVRNDEELQDDAGP